MSGIIFPPVNRSLSQSSNVRSKNSAKKEKPASTMSWPAAKTEIEISQPQETQQTETNTAYQKLCDYLHTLHQENPTIHFKIASLNDEESIRNFAMSTGSGAHMSISAKFLNTMLDDEESFSNGQKRINNVVSALLSAIQEQQRSANTLSIGAVIKDGGQASLWTASMAQPSEDETVKKFFDIMKNSGMIRNYKEKSGRNITEIRTSKGIFKFIFVKRLNYSSTKDLKRLARIAKPGNIRAFMSKLNAYANQIRGDKTLDEKEANTAIAKIRSVIARAKFKIKNLHDEDLLKQQNLRQIKWQEAKRALETRRQLQKKRMARRAREYGAIDRNPLSPDYFNDKKYAEDSFSGNNLLESSAPTIDIAASANAVCASSLNAASISIEAINIKI